MKKLVITTFAFKDDYKTSPQIGNTINNNVIDFYLKNAFVCLKSVQKNNPDTDVMFITNCELPPVYNELYLKNNIKIEVIPFDSFTYPKNVTWSLAFFKLCAFKHAIKNLNYDKYLILDNDVYCVDSIEDMWQEADNGILLYNVGHRFSHKDRQRIIECSKYYFGETKNVVHYGGEMIAGNRDQLENFISICDDIYSKTYDDIVSNDIDDLGDEFIISFAAESIKIIEATAYLFRYWTLKDFYLASTNWKSNAVLLWHLPGEKTRGMIKLYKYYIKHGDFPEIAKAANMVGLQKAKRPFVLSDYQLKIEKAFRIITGKEAR